MNKNTDNHTKEKTAEIFNTNKYKKYNDFYQKITAYAPAKILITNDTGNCTYLSKSWYDYTGQTSETGLGDGWMEAVHSKDREQLKRTLLKAIKNKTYFETTYRLKKNSGIYRWHICGANPVLDSNGNLEAMVGTVSDVHKQKTAEEALRRNEKWYKTYAEAMPQMAFVADAKGNIIYFNQRWYDYVGDTENTKGWEWKNQSIHHPDDLTRTVNTWKHSLETGKNYEIEYRLKRFDGEYRWHLGRATPVCGEDGNIKFWLGTNTDIDQQKKIEERLQKMVNRLKTQNAKLNQMRKLRENLLHIIGHDLRGPIGNIKLGLELFDSVQDEKDKAEIIRGLQKMVEKQQKVIDGLSELISVQNPRDVQFKPVNLDEVMHDILNEFQFYFEKEDKITYDFKEVPVILYVHSFAYSILKNLISNAIKYRSDENPLEVEVKSQKADGFVLLSVKDNGIGINLEKHGKDLFHVFRRLTDKADGSGIGLYIVKNLLEGNGGKIAVESEPGRGSTFICFLKEYT